MSDLKIFTAPNAVDTEWFANQANLVRRDADLHRHALRLPSFFLFVGRLVAEKRVFELVQAYGKLSVALKADIGLVFVGDGPVRSDLSRCASAIAPGTMQFAGFAQREELAKYYGLAETFFEGHSLLDSAGKLSGGWLFHHAIVHVYRNLPANSL